MFFKGNDLRKPLYFLTCHSLFPHAVLICDLVLFPPLSFPAGVPCMLRFIVRSCRGSLKGRVSAAALSSQLSMKCFLVSRKFQGGLDWRFSTLRYCIKSKFTAQSTQSGPETDKVMVKQLNSDKNTTFDSSLLKIDVVQHWTCVLSTSYSQAEWHWRFLLSFPS